MRSEETQHDLRDRAMALASSLCRDNPEIDWQLADIVGHQIDAVAGELDFDDSYWRICRSHRFRIAASVRELRGLIQPGCRVLELGGTTFVSHILLAHFPESEWRVSTWDLRRPWPTRSESFDLVVSMEVFEHLSDTEEGRNEQLELRGLRTCLTECRRTLRHGGVLFGTTPNSASAYCLQKILGGATGMYYWPHIREYCREEISRELEDADFRIESLRAVQCMSLGEGFDYAPVFHLLLELGYPTEDRGDDWFFRAKATRLTGDEVETS